MLRPNLGPWILLVALATAAAGPAAAQDEPRYAGRPLVEALRDLQARGLRVLFTSEVVRPEMRVEAEPAPGTPRQVLDRLLAPHGLAAEPGPGGTLVVVRAPPPEALAGIHGRVLDRYGTRPLEGVQVLVPGTELSTTSAPDGRFALPEAPPGTYVVEARRPGFVVERREGVRVAAGAAAEVVFELVPAPVPLDEVVVTPSTISLLLSDPVVVFSFGRDEILALPNVGDDVFRALTLLPGTSSSEFSAEFQIRGGRADEVLVMLDQLELFEPFHLRDFSNALSIVAPRAIAEVDLILGGFPARFGDRMGGVLDMRTARGGGERRTLVGLSAVTAQASSSGGFAGGRGEWLGVARRSSLELVSGFLGQDERPRFGDAFGKVAFQLRPAHRLGARVLRAEDRLDFLLREEGDVERADTSYGSSYVWLTHQGLRGSRLFVDSIVSRGRVDRDRRAGEDEGEGEGFTLTDARVLDVAGLKQDWNLHSGGGRPGREHYWRWGFDLRRLDTEYDYANERRLEDPFPDLRSEPRTGVTDFRRRFEGEQVGLYLSDRLRLLPSLTAELGLRYDEQTITGDRDLSPRFNLVLATGERSTLRGAWGHYFQSQRPYELRVEDGETAFFGSERTEQTVVGFDHVFPRGESLRLDVYRRDVVNPRPRYENAFEPGSPFPEIEADRVRIAPERSRAEGVELFVRGREGQKLGWWANYAYARTRDRLDGREVPRRIDQPHALNLDLSYRPGAAWTVNLAFRYHTGWPTTTFGGRVVPDDEGDPEVVFEVGPLYGARLPDYHRLDLRLSRTWKLERGELTVALDLQNLYDRRNIAGFNVEPDLVELPGGASEVRPVEETWGGFLPSVGIEWEF